MTTGELDEVMGALIGRACFRLVVDLAGVHYISSAGWGVFVSRLREAREGGGDIKLARMQEPVREVYDLLEFEGLLPHHDRLEDARAGFDGGSPQVSLSDMMVPESSRGLRSVSLRRDRPEQHGNGDSPFPPYRESSTGQAVGAVVERSVSRQRGTPAPTTLEEAVVQLVLEDPFYSLGELKSRLAEVSDFRAGRWAIWQVLRRRKLIRQKQRFRLYRRRHTAAPAAWR